MDVLIQYTYRASKKEPFGALLRRIHDGLHQASLPVSYDFTFADPPVAGGVSAVDRAVKKFPQLAAMVTSESLPGLLGVTQKAIGGSDTDIPFHALAEVADGLPRSLPFHSATVRFTGPAFGGGETLPLTGIIAADSWWVNGRQRRLVACFILDVAESAPKTRGAATAPAPDGPVAVFLATSLRRRFRDIKNEA